MNAPATSKSQSPQEPGIQAPQSSLPEDVEKFLLKHYRKAKSILEYGSGASTVAAAGLKGKTIHSVESDKMWARNLKRYLRQADLPSQVVVQHVDIGKTGKWGRPVDEEGRKYWYRYPTSVWDLESFKHPDCILIDGRFRVACLYTAMIRAQKPITVLFDDYGDRARYQSVEKIIAPAEIVGRMARFEVTPGDFPRAHTTEVIAAFSQPF